MTLKGRDTRALICCHDSQGRLAIEVRVDRYLAVISVFLLALRMMAADEARPLIDSFSRPVRLLNDVRVLKVGRS